jgi:D-lactate dehydrogenase
MKIGFFEIEEWEKEPLRKAFPKDKLVFSKDKLTLKNADKNLEAISVFIYSKVNESLLKKMPKLRLVCTRSTGFDHIDLEACKKRKITVCNVPAYGENTVAEHTFALVLALAKKLIDSVERTRKGNFELKGLRGFDLKGKTLGVMGCGSIGRHVVRIAKGFEMNILVFDVCKDSKFAKKMGFKYVGMDVLLKNSDIVTLHVPLNEHTHHLIDKKRIGLMKKGAWLINTSRGEVVSTDALVKALKLGRLAGAGLDVLEKECVLKEERELLTKEFTKTCDLKTILEEHILLGMPNVIVTPHNAFNTNEALMRILEVTIENIGGFKKGKKVNVIKG